MLDGTLSPGDKTKARFTLRPATTDKTRVFQFVVVGVDDGGNLGVGRATWGTNGRFGGPRTMPQSGPLPAAMAAGGDCVTSGLSFTAITNVTWKAFMIEIRTRGKVNLNAIVDVVVKARPGATVGVYPVVGVTGIWLDDGDGVVNAADQFACSGMATSTVNVS